MQGIDTQQVIPRPLRFTLGTSPSVWDSPQKPRSRPTSAGWVDDVGKIGLAAGLLEKPGALSLEERRQMEQHSIIGERI